MCSHLSCCSENIGINEFIWRKERPQEWEGPERTFTVNSCCCSEHLQSMNLPSCLNRTSQGQRQSKQMATVGTLRYSHSNGRNCHPGAKLIYFRSVLRSNRFFEFHSGTMLLMLDNMGKWNCFHLRASFSIGQSSKMHEMGDSWNEAWRTVLSLAARSFKG